MRSDQCTVNESDPRVRQILERNRHPVTLCPRRTNEEHAVPLARLQCEPTITLAMRLGQFTQIGQSFINRNGHMPGDWPPINRMLSNISACWLLQIHEGAE